MKEFMDYPNVPKKAVKKLVEITTKLSQQSGNFNFR